MRRKQGPDGLKIAIIALAAVILIVAIAGSVYLFSLSKKLKAIDLTPDFSFTELEVGSEYTFTVSATPSKASIKKAECVCDDSTASFEMDSKGRATLITGLSEGTVTIYVEYKDIKSQVLTYNVVDSVARAQAEAEAAAAAEQVASEQAELEIQSEAETEVAASKSYVKCNAADVRVRAQNNTDCDVLGKAKNGEVFEKVEDIDDWSHIIYKGQDAYMKTEYLTTISEEEYQQALANPVAEEPKAEEKPKQEEQPKKDAAQSQAEAEAKAAAAAAQAAAEQQAALEAAAAAAAAAQAASGLTINCADGPHTFPQEKYNFIKGFWSYTGDWEAMAHKHTEQELNLICQIEGGIN